jgi:hypothetical protein
MRLRVRLPVSGLRSSIVGLRDPAGRGAADGSLARADLCNATRRAPAS